MAKINENYLQLPGSYLFSEIGRRVNHYKEEHPNTDIIRLGISDVTRPLAPAVIAAGILALRIAGLSMPFLGISFTLAGGLRGAGDTTSVLIILGVCIWGLRIANAYWLGPLLGLTGIWTAVGADFVVRAVLMSLRFRSGKWKRIQV